MHLSRSTFLATIHFTMTAPPVPSEENAYLADHVALLRNSFRHWIRRPLVDHRMTDADAARYLFFAPFAVVSHNADKDPLFNYANRTALSLFGMTWEELTATPSRLSAERENQQAHEQLLATVAECGHVDGYEGVRVGRHARRFTIEQATIWNLRDARGMVCGQAARFKHWKFL
jgi:hypothetical protein